MEKQPVRSPIEMVIEDKRLTAILEAMRDGIKCGGEFLVPVKDVCRIREVIRAPMEEGERGLYRFAHDLVEKMVGLRVSLYLEVWDRCFHREHRVIQKCRARLPRSFGDLTNEAGSYRSNLHAPACPCGERIETLLYIRKTDFTGAPFGNTECQTSIKRGYSNGSEGFTLKEISYARL